MKKNLLLVIIVALCLGKGHAQFFSGELQYDKRIIPKVKDLNVDSIFATSPAFSVYWITQGYYKTKYRVDGRDFYSYTYHGDTKKMYDESTDKDYITFRDSRKSNNIRIRSIVYKDSTKVIAGYKCFMVERIYQNYITKTYYAFNLKIDAESFKDHATGDWYFQIKEVDGALSLGSIVEYATHYEIDEVVKVIPRDLKPSDFKLPTNKIVVASADALDTQVELIQPSNEAIICYQHKMQVKMESTPSADYVAYIGFIVSANGNLSHVEPYEEDEPGFSKVAVDIISNCGLQFKPGKIDGVEVDSWVYFPIQFRK